MKKERAGMQNSDLTKLPNKLDAKQFHCRAIIETPKGARNKFNYDPESGLFMLGGLLPEGMMFPFDFGFIPSTSAGDGDPLDIMVLMDAPATTGCLIDVRLIGVIEAMQAEDGDKERNDRILGVALHSYDHQHLRHIRDVSKTLLDQVEEFFICYNKQRGKKFKVDSLHGPRRALKCLQKSMAAAEKKSRPAKSARALSPVRDDLVHGRRFHMRVEARPVKVDDLVMRLVDRAEERIGDEDRAIATVDRAKRRREHANVGFATGDDQRIDVLAL
jgi:inorganic pyrophosphatase